jgi:hypothetical protein
MELGVVPQDGSDRLDQHPGRRRAGTIGEDRQCVAGEDHADGDARRHADDGARFGALFPARTGPQAAYEHMAVRIAWRQLHSASMQPGMH